MNLKKITLGLAMQLAILISVGIIQAAGSSWSVKYQLPSQDSTVRLEQPVAMTVDRRIQRYYVADAGNGQLVSFDKNGAFLAAFTAGAQLQHPVAVARTSKGNLWVIERSTNELLYINPREEKVKRFSPEYPDGTGVFLTRLKLDQDDKLYALDRRKGRVVQFDDFLKIIQEFSGSEESSGFSDFVIQPEGLWILDGLGKSLHKFNFQGEPEETLKLQEAGFPIALEIDMAGSYYLLDRHTGSVSVYDAGGRRSYQFLGKGKRSGQIWAGTDLMFDWDGQLCVVDEGNGRVEVLTR